MSKKYDRRSFINLATGGIGKDYFPPEMESPKKDPAKAYSADKPVASNSDCSFRYLAEV